MRKTVSIQLTVLIIACSCVNSANVGAASAEMVSKDSLCYPIDSISVDSNEVHTCTSEDGNMKFYSWNTGMGGTCPDYAVVCQFRNKDGKAITEDFSVKESMPAWVSRVHSIKKNDDSTYYITVRSHRASSNDGYMWMDGFVIDQDSVRNVSVLDGGDDLDECGLDINYRISDWYYTTNGDGWGWLFEYDTQTKNLYVPIVVYIEESIPIISDRYRVYHFNGMEFVDMGESPHKGLYKPLCNYKRLARYFRTKNYIVRIDMMDNGNYRYASWKATSNMSSKPELIVTNGIYDADKEIYKFTNEGVEYIADYSEDKPLPEGGFEHHEFLIVKRNGKVILKEEKLTNTD